ncbi:MAG: hypothetical protein RMM58_12295 [Chloroflexota bacterium]|nr:hypothetical protein [Dehalococcoidia bacterium]MDW8254648.1 hypothetical protein [Chloroflexota bacterium]
MTPPDEAMADWEARLWQLQTGTWSGKVTTRAVDGALIDEYDVVTDVAVDLAANRYAQRVVTMRGGRAEARTFTAHWEGRDLVVRSPRFTARARAAAARVIVLTGRSADGSSETVETITLLTDHTRARTVQHIEAGRLRAVTVVSNEQRQSPLPGIDLAGEPLPQRGPAL